MAGEFDFEPMSAADVADLCGRWIYSNETRMARELRASRAALRKVVEASCTDDEENAAMKTARALVAHVGGERGAS